MSFRNASMAALLVLAAPIAASAAQVDISNIVGTWSNAIPGATIAGSGTANPTARWGTDLGNGLSGYNFDATPGTVGIVVPPSPSGNFFLGDFTHVNQPIGAPSITGITLTVTAQVVIDSVNQGTRNFVFNFQHDETPNGDAPCAFGGANNQGVNINGCADRVRVNASNTTEDFVIGADTYTLNILGFNENGNFVTDFLTVEQANNVASLVANVTLRSDVVVPEPASLALFGVGMLGLAAAYRRRRAA